MLRVFLIKFLDWNNILFYQDPLGIAKILNDCGIDLYAKNNNYLILKLISHKKFYCRKHSYRYCNIDKKYYLMMSVYCNTHIYNKMLYTNYIKDILIGELI